MISPLDLVCTAMVGIAASAGLVVDSTNGAAYVLLKLTSQKFVQILQQNPKGKGNIPLPFIINIFLTFMV